MVMDVAPGVDWTAMVAILMAVQQVRHAGSTVGSTMCSVLGCTAGCAATAACQLCGGTSTVIPSHIWLIPSPAVLWCCNERAGRRTPAEGCTGQLCVGPLKEQAVQGVIEGAGMQDAAASAGHSMDSAMHFMRKAQELHRIFFA